MQRRHFLQMMAAAATLPTFNAFANSSNTTSVLVGATPGGGTDLIARELTHAMAAHIDRTFVVDNKPGAAGNIATEATARAKPDGSTLLVSYTSHVINPSLYPELPFDPVTDFTPLCGIASQPAVLVARPSFEANNMAELIAMCKKRPGDFTMAIAGIGSANHLSGAMLQTRANIDLLPVPYKGTAPALSAVAAGHVDLAIGGAAVVRGMIDAGRLKPLGVTSADRLTQYPDVQAIADELPDFAYSSWYGLFGPAGMDPALAKKFSDAAVEALESDALRGRLVAEGMVPMGLTHEKFKQFVVNEIDRWRKVVTETGTTIG